VSDPADVAATFCATLVDEWVRAGLTDAVVCPGSRSTPMALALAADGRLVLHVHHDERAASFLALGLAMATGRPAVVLTTSGTAAVELHPAVVEAHHARLPMVVCTADRPPELRDVGAPQTIDQVHLFGRSVRWFAEPGVPDLAAASRWRPLAARAVAEALGAPPGPVHLNLSFREPLVGVAADLPPGRAGDRPWTRRPPAAGPPSSADVAALASALDGRRVLVVAGGAIDDPDGVLAVAQRLGWPVVADPRSGCRVRDAVVVSHADAVLRHLPSASALRPDVVLRCGTPPASKVLAQWLAGLDAWQVGVDTWGAVLDPDGVLDSVVTAEPGALGRALADQGIGRSPDGWLSSWARADATAGESIAASLTGDRCGDQPTEPLVAADVVAALPDGTTLIVSSSMPVRDVEWYSAPRDGVRVLANRGANGIDGVVSTAVGVALAGGPTAVLIGDVAFLHDTNALLGLDDRAVDLTIVVVDNRGGGIFSFLPQASTVDPAVFESLFGTPHDVDLAALAAAHGLVTLEVHDGAALAETVRTSMATGGVRLVVVRTDRSANPAAHDRIHTAVARALDDPTT